MELLDKINLDEEQQKAADVNFSGDVEIRDLVKLRMIILEAE